METSNAQLLNIRHWLDTVVETVAQVCSDLFVYRQSTVDKSFDTSSDVTAIRNLEMKVKRLEQSIRVKDENQKLLENKIFNLGEDHVAIVTSIFN